MANAHEALDTMVSQIDTKIQLLEEQIKEARSKLAALQTTKATLLAEFGAKTRSAADLFRGAAVSLSESTAERVRRRDQIITFLRTNGPHSRRDISELTKIPEGTLAYEMRDRNIFVLLEDGRWDLTDDHKRILRSRVEEEAEDLAF